MLRLKLIHVSIRGPWKLLGLTLIPAWLVDYTHYNVWDEIAFPFAKFKLKFHSWSLGMDKWFHSALYSACNHPGTNKLSTNDTYKFIHMFWQQSAHIVAPPVTSIALGPAHRLLFGTCLVWFQTEGQVPGGRSHTVRSSGSAAWPLFISNVLATPLKRSVWCCCITRGLIPQDTAPAFWRTTVKAKGERGGEGTLETNQTYHLYWSSKMFHGIHHIVCQKWVNTPYRFPNNFWYAVCLYEW